MNQLRVVKSLKWASVVFTLTRWLMVDDFGAAPWGIIRAFTLLTIRMANIIGVLFFEFLWVNVGFFAHFLLPVRKTLLQ